MTLGELQRRLRAVLTEALPAGEAEGCVRAILEDAGGYTPVDLALPNACWAWRAAWPRASRCSM